MLYVDTFKEFKPIITAHLSYFYESIRNIKQCFCFLGNYIYKTVLIYCIFICIFPILNSRCCKVVRGLIIKAILYLGQ